jgi:hypothetical protein
MFTDETAATYAGAVAASGLAVAKQLPLRNSAPVGLSSRLRPAALGDLPRLFSKSKTRKQHENIARVSSAGIVYSVNKDRTAESGRLLNGDEVETLNSLWTDRQAKKGQKKLDRTCPYCRLLLKTLYKPQSGQLPRVVVVNHTAGIDVSFSPDTNISEAKINKFQVLVPQRVAAEMVKCGQPLHWGDMQGTLFRSIRAVEGSGKDGVFKKLSAEQADYEWQEKAKAGEAFIFEDCAIPLNTDLVASVQNVLAIRGFSRNSSSGIDSLKYEYSLENCVGSHFGIAFEPSGLDIDGGKFQIETIPASFLYDGTRLSDNQQPQALMRRDIAEMDALLGNQAVDIAGSELASPDDTRKKIIEVAQRLSDQEHEPYSLVTVTASKRLHFTLPENGPVELWELLTWTAPAFLFTFINLAVCLAPHMLLDAMSPPAAIASQDSTIYRTALPVDLGSQYDE